MRFAFLLFGLLLGAVAPAAAQQSSSPTAPRLTKAPELLEFVEAPYPQSELNDPRSAEVIVSLMISADGTVTDALVVTSAGAAFDAAALEAVQKFVFSPAEIDEVKAAVKITYRYVFEPPPPAVTVGSFQGVILDRTSGKPISGATIRIAGHDDVLSDDQGRFSISDVEAGVVTVVVVAPGLPEPLSVEEEITAGSTTEAQYDIVLPEPEPLQQEDADDYEVVVVAPPRLERRVVSTKVKAEEARQLPGTQGDVLKVVESMPGVGRASAGSGDVMVWGAAPGDTRTYVGAVRIPSLYHFGGLRSVLHGDLISDLELVPGGYGAAYGRGLGGLILIETKAPEKNGLHGSVQADLLDASVVVTSPISKKNSFIISGRKSYVKELSTLVVDDSFGQYFSVPSYYDGAARFRHDLDPDQSVEVGGMISGDAQERVSPSNNPQLRSSERRSLNFQRVDLRYEKKTAEGQHLIVTPWYGRDAHARELSSAGVEQEQSSISHIGGLRIDYRSRLSSVLSARTGFDLEVVSSSSTRTGSLTTPPREGDPYVFGRAPADELAYDNWNSTLVTAAPYLELDFAPFDELLHIQPGLRVDPYVQTVNRSRPLDATSPDLATLTESVGVEPRLAVAYAPLSMLSFRAGGGLYRQPPASDDLSSVFGNPQLERARGAHALLGLKYQMFELIALEATGFYTRTWDIGSRNPSSTPKVAEALVQEGEGRTFGGQFLLRKDRGEDRLHGWITYTIMRTERRDAGKDEYRFSSFDQSHVFTAIASYDFGLGFEFGLRARVASGFPRTPVKDAYVDVSRGRYEPILGEINSIRIPLFFQLDARLSKKFDFGTSDLEVYLDVQNVTNRSNAEEIAYSPDYEEQRFVSGLPILPVIGARWEF